MIGSFNIAASFRDVLAARPKLQATRRVAARPAGPKPWMHRTGLRPVSLGRSADPGYYLRHNAGLRTGFEIGMGATTATPSRVKQLGVLLAGEVVAVIGRLVLGAAERTIAGPLSKETPVFDVAVGPTLRQDVPCNLFATLLLSVKWKPEQQSVEYEGVSGGLAGQVGLLGVSPTTLLGVQVQLV